MGYANVITGMLVMPVNTYEDLRLLDSGSKHLESRRMALISQLFDVSAGEVTDIHPLSSGMTNHLMHFCCKGKDYPAYQELYSERLKRHSPHQTSPLMT